MTSSLPRQRIPRQRGPRPNNKGPAILSLIQQSPQPITVAEIVGRLGCAFNTVRRHLHTLLDGGQIVRCGQRPRTDATGKLLEGRRPDLFRAATHDVHTVAA